MWEVHVIEKERRDAVSDCSQQKRNESSDRSLHYAFEGKGDGDEAV